MFRAMILKTTKQNITGDDDYIYVHRRQSGGEPQEENPLRNTQENLPPLNILKYRRGLWCLK